MDNSITTSNSPVTSDGSNFIDSKTMQARQANNEQPQSDNQVQSQTQSAPQMQPTNPSIQSGSIDNSNVTIPTVRNQQQYIYPSQPQQQQHLQHQSSIITANETPHQHLVTMPQPIKPLLENDAPKQSSNQTQVPIPTRNQLGASPQKAVITRVKLTDDLNIFDWFRTTDIINQLAEKARNSVGSVITTLDPGMKEYLYSGGNINVMVISDSDCLISPIRDAFQTVFGRATVSQAKRKSPSEAPDYPIKLACGFDEAVTLAKEKIRKLRLDTNDVPQNQVMAVVQPSLVTLKKSNSDNDGPSQQDSSPKWFLTYCMLLEDPVLKLAIDVPSQFIPLDDDIAIQATKESIYPNDFNQRHLGYTVTIDQLMSSKLGLSETDRKGDDYGSLWLRLWSGNYETQLIHQSCLSLAHAYRRKWDECVQIETLS